MFSVDGSYPQLRSGLGVWVARRFWWGQNSSDQLSRFALERATETNPEAL